MDTRTNSFTGTRDRHQYAMNFDPAADHNPAHVTIGTAQRVCIVDAIFLADSEFCAAGVGTRATKI